MIATILQAAGLLIISTGMAWIYPPAGLVTLGISALLFGLALDRENR